MQSTPEKVQFFLFIRRERNWRRLWRQGISTVYMTHNSITREEAVTIARQSMDECPVAVGAAIIGSDWTQKLTKDGYGIDISDSRACDD